MSLDNIQFFQVLNVKKDCELILKDIQFFYAYNKKRGGRKPKYKLYERKVTKSKLFEEKVKRIKQLSGSIKL